MSAAIVRMAMSRSMWEKFRVLGGQLKEVFNHLESDCVRLMDNEHLMKHVRDEGYQFAVVDAMMTQCYYGIPYSLGIPYASVSVSALTWVYRVPRFPSFAPSKLLTYTDRMSFVQRLTTFLFEQLLQLQIQDMTTTYVDRMAHDRPSLNGVQLMQRV